eukprot:TRINITY_DN17074_c0_g2_i1.p1 TRINITY_DN17074_c0_g2~~TRINITY_DN17074_c0_g2_i1.p1  ORF type:complete len:287 (+),score=35.91 TRINITY_DN17074_c0_g2_i1:46-861(+)
MTQDQGIGMFPQLLGVSQFLESHPAVTDVKFFDKAGVTKAAVAKWELSNQPFQLPEDLASFLAISDGLLLKWSILLNRSPIQGIGNTHINSLAQITRYDDQSIEEGKTAFVLDGTPSMYGKVCLLYEKDRPYSPSIWFQSLSCSWHFVAHTFTDYFRLLIMHLGLPGWCHTYTETGLPNVTEEWFGFLSPERFHIDRLKGYRSKNQKQPPLVDIEKLSECLDKGTTALSGTTSSKNDDLHQHQQTNGKLPPGGGGDKKRRHNSYSYGSMKG